MYTIYKHDKALKKTSTFLVIYFELYLKKGSERMIGVGFGEPRFLLQGLHKVDFFFRQRQNGCVVFQKQFSIRVTRSQDHLHMLLVPSSS